MSVLLNEIKNIDRTAAAVLKAADLCSDCDIRSLTREDLCELLPGTENFRLRRKIFALIHNQKPIDVVMKNLKGFFPQESLRAALTDNGVLVDYLYLLKDMKGQMNNVQGFLDAHIDLLEELRKDQPAHESDQGTSASDKGKRQTDGQPEKEQVRPGTSASDRGKRQTDGQPQKEQGESFTIVSSQDAQEATVKYHPVVSGKTFNAHQQLMDKVKEQFQGYGRLVESSDDHQVNILFCPITSRIGSDVEAAMSDIKDDKPVILVLMHHEREPKYTTSVRTWSSKIANVEFVNVFYHDTKQGLITCQENDDVVFILRSKLLKFVPLRLQNTRGNAQGAGAERRGTGSAAVSGGGNSIVSGFLSIFPRR